MDYFSGNGAQVVLVRDFSMGLGQVDEVDLERGVIAHPIVVLILQTPDGVVACAVNAHAGNRLGELIRVHSRAAIEKFDRPSFRQIRRQERKVFALLCGIVAVLAALNGLLTWWVDKDVWHGVSDGFSWLLTASTLFVTIMAVMAWHRRRRMVKRILHEAEGHPTTMGDGS